VETYDLAEAAKRSGIGVDELGRLIELGILTPVAGNRFTPGHLRRAGLVIGLTGAGVPVGQAGEVIVSQAVVDASAGAAVAFRDVGPVELRGVSGSMRLHAASPPG
jgi:hypothetical protein